MKLNIGSGEHPLDGYLNIDIREGGNAVPVRIPDTVQLPEGVGEFHREPDGTGWWSLKDNVADMVRASHMLEHLSYKDVELALAEWLRVLKPGGIVRVSVPDFDKIINVRANMPESADWRFYVVGGQTYAENFHRSVFDHNILAGYLQKMGFEDVRPWHSSDLDCSKHPVSLNMEANKPDPTPLQVKISAVLSRPRYGTAAFWDCATTALAKHNIPLNSLTGVFWGQCMQRAFEFAIDKGVEWLLTLDYDTQFTADHVGQLMQWLKRRPDIDAIAAMQCRRGSPYPLMTVMEMAEGNEGKTAEIAIDGSPVLVCSAHFGLTLLRMEALKRVPKPWFWSTPSEGGRWEEGRFDDDIYFWHNWRKAGNTIYVATDTQVGHIEEMVAVFDEHLKPKHIYVTDWRKQHGIGDQDKKIS